MKDHNDNTLLHLAIVDNQTDIIKYFLNKKLPVNIKNKNGDTPLHLAMKTNNFDVRII